MNDQIRGVANAISDASAELPPAKAAKAKIVLIVIAIVVVIAIIVIAVVGITSATKTKTLTSSSLSNVANITKLSTADVSYEGIADKYDEKGNPVYHVFYKSTVTASVDMSQIDFSDIDHEKKVVRPKLPEIVIGDPVIDETSFDFLPDNPGVDMREVIELCKEDAQRDAAQDDLIMDTAKRNLKQVIEALTKPILDEAGYELDWSNVDTEEADDATA